MVRKGIRNNDKKVTLWMVIKYFLKKSRPYKWLLFLSILGRLIITGVGLLLPIYQTKLVDIVAMTGVERVDLVAMLIRILLIILALNVVNIAARRLISFPMIKYETDATKDIYEECFKYMHKHSYRFFTDNLSGSLVRKIGKLAGSYETVVDIFVFQILNIVISIPMICIIVMRQNVKI